MKGNDQLSSSEKCREMANGEDMKQRLERALKNPSFKKGRFDVNHVRFRQIGTSTEHILIDNGPKLLLFHKTGSNKVEIEWNRERNGFIKDIVWCCYLNKFIILGVNILFTFDCTQFNIEQIQNQDFSYLNFIGVQNENLLLNFSNKRIEHWQMNMDLKLKFIQRWSHLKLGYDMNESLLRLNIAGDQLAINIKNNQKQFVIDVYDDIYKMNRLYRVNDEKYNLRLLSSIYDNQWLSINDATKQLYHIENNRLVEIKYNREI
ncbi:unnamed protein product, partial [Didymodactylos carnosus]